MFLDEKISLEEYYKLNVQLELYDRDGLPKHVDDRSPQYPDRLGSDGYNQDAMCPGEPRVGRQREREQDCASRSRSYLFV